MEQGNISDKDIIAPLSLSWAHTKEQSIAAEVAQ